jgi:hypothetical protein
LIKGKALSSGLGDSSSSSLGESESGNGELWNVNKSIVISDGGNGNDSFVPKS